MAGRREAGESAPDAGAARAICFCVVPPELAEQLHDPLRKHFREDPSIEVVVESRLRERRKTPDRRHSSDQSVEDERRAIRNEQGRRVGDRRALAVPVDAPPAAAKLPRRLRRHLDALTFLERLEPASQVEEDLDTARLVIRIQQGDREAFSQLYMRYFDRVYGYLRLLLKDRHEAEDATQQVFINALEEIGRYERRRGTPFRAWLFVLARNRALKMLGKQERLDVMDPAALDRRRDCSSSLDDDAQLVIDWLSDRDLVMLIERIPVVQRQVLLLRYMLDLPHAEIARILERTEDDVRSLHSRGIRFLRQRLAALGREASDSRRIRMRRPVKPAPVTGARRWSLVA